MLALVIVRMFTEQPKDVAFARRWWDKSMLADLSMFALFEIIFTALSTLTETTTYEGTVEIAKTTPEPVVKDPFTSHPVAIQLFAGFVTIIFFYEFVVPVLFPLSAIPSYRPS